MPRRLPTKGLTGLSRYHEARDHVGSAPSLGSLLYLRFLAMKRSEAKALAWKLRQEGKDMEAIAKALADTGYVGRAGTALTAGGVRQMMGNLGVKKTRRKRLAHTPARRAPPKVAAVKSPARLSDSRIKLIRTICAQETMAPEDRLAAILLLT